MKTYLYEWHINVDYGLRMSVEVAASSASGARQTVNRFLEEHNGREWVVESISRFPRSVGIKEMRTDERAGSGLQPSRSSAFLPQAAESHPQPVAKTEMVSWR